MKLNKNCLIYIFCVYVNNILYIQVAKSAVAVEYTDCFSAERWEPHNECAGYDTKQSDGEVPVMLELWGVRSTPLLPPLPGPIWPGVVAPDTGPIYGFNRNKLCFLHYTDFSFKLCIYAKLNCLKQNCFDI